MALEALAVGSSTGATRARSPLAEMSPYYFATDTKAKIPKSHPFSEAKNWDGISSQQQLLSHDLLLFKRTIFPGLPFIHSLTFLHHHAALLLELKPEGHGKKGSRSMRSMKSLREPTPFWGSPLREIQVSCPPHLPIHTLLT